MLFCPNPVNLNFSTFQKYLNMSALILGGNESKRQNMFSGTLNQLGGHLKWKVRCRCVDLMAHLWS